MQNEMQKPSDKLKAARHTFSLLGFSALLLLVGQLLVSVLVGICIGLFFPEGNTPAWLAMLVAVIAGILAGLCTGLLHVKLGIPVILAGILTQLALYSINLRIMDSKANQALSVDKYPLLLSQRYVRELSLNNPLPSCWCACSTGTSAPSRAPPCARQAQTPQ